MCQLHCTVSITPALTRAGAASCLTKPQLGHKSFSNRLPAALDTESPEGQATLCCASFCSATVNACGGCVQKYVALSIRVLLKSNIHINWWMFAGSHCSTHTHTIIITRHDPTFHEIPVFDANNMSNSRRSMMIHVCLGQNWYMCYGHPPHNGNPYNVFFQKFLFMD